MKVLTSFNEVLFAANETRELHRATAVAHDAKLPLFQPRQVKLNTWPHRNSAHLHTWLLLKMNRRQFLKTGLAATAGILMPWPAMASLINKNHRSLSLYNTHTGEHLHNIVYWEKGSYQHDSLQQINHLLRDHRTGEIKAIDPNLLDVLHELHGKIPVDKPFEIISGYRSPATNRHLQAHSTGIATKSLHMAGQAIDIRLRGYPLANLRKTAAAMKRGGVGYYPHSNFVHIDTGRVRYW